MPKEIVSLSDVSFVAVINNCIHPRACCTLLELYANFVANWVRRAQQEYLCERQPAHKLVNAYQTNPFYVIYFDHVRSIYAAF
jgi:hypothetical protein